MRYNAVIGGGGAAGLAMALALAEGLGPTARIALVTPQAAPLAPRAGARAVALSAAAIRMLDQLGVWSLCAGEAQPVTAIDITDSSLEAGIRPVLLSYDNVLGSAEPASQIVPDGALDFALSTAVSSRPAIERIAGSTIASFISGPFGVNVSLSSGRTLAAPLLIAADGRRSGLRDMAGIRTTGWPYHQTGITVITRHERPHEGRAVQHFLPSGPFAMLPLPGNRTCITWTEEEKEAIRLMALEDAAFLAELERRAGGRLGAFTLEGQRQSWPLDVFIARTFIAPRFALVGDAAHGVHPIAGQGLNLGLRDVAALAEVLTDAARVGLDIGHGSVLDGYERWRRFDTLTSAAGFDALNRLFSTPSGLRRAAREAGLGLVDRMPGLKRHLVAEAAGDTGNVPRLMRGERI